MRLLDVRKRDVTPDRIEAYRAAWGTLQTLVTAAGGHAWVFTGTANAGVFLEFIEFGESGSRLPPAIATAAAALDNIAASRDAGTWKEWTN